MKATSSSTTIKAKNASSSISTATSKSKSAASSNTKLAHGGTTSALVDANIEIEEISKKISEHADAIYRTWKCRGLAPTELLELYSNAAAVTDTTGGSSGNDFFAAKVVEDDNATTEGLQKLVSSFVIKDKEQRGVKTGGSNSGTGSGGGVGTANNKSTVTRSANAEAKITVRDNMAGKVTHKNVQIIKQPTTAATAEAAAVTKPVALKSAAHRRAGHHADVVDAAGPAAVMISKKSASAKSGTAVKTVASVNANSSSNMQKANTVHQQPHQHPHPHQHQQQQQEQQQQLEQDRNVRGAVNTTVINTPVLKKTKISTPAVAADADTSADFRPLDMNLNFDLELNLNVNNLTQLQTQNLLKIKELLHENAKQAKERKSGTQQTMLTRTKVSADATKPTITASAGAAVTATPTATLNDNHSGGASANKRTAKSSNSSSSSANVISADKNSSVATAITTKTAIAASAAVVPNATLSAAGSAHNMHIKSPHEQQEHNSNSSSHNKTPTKEDDKVQKSGNRIVKSGTKETNNGSGSRNIANSTARPALKLKQQKDSKPTASASANAPPTTPNKDHIAMEVARSSMPAPTATKKSGRAAFANGQDQKNLGRPILTRGSVAERVLMFEKCPDMRSSFLNIKRPDPADAPPKSLLKVKLHATPPTQPENSLQKEIRSTKSVYIPRFYFPHGKPQPTIALERTLRGILSAFDSFPNNQVTKDELPRILKLCGLPFYWRMPVMIFCQQGNSGLVERQRFVEFWKQMNVYCHEAASRFVYILSRGQRFRSYILPEDLVSLVQDVVDTHPGLAFLKEAIEFHSRYVHTVIARIFYSVNRSWSGKISISELKKSDLLEIISLLEEEDDINQIMAFFSYEHFYVIYCKFWELDKDHDLLISQEDLSRHSDHALSTRIVERIFAGSVTRSDNKKSEDDEAKMSYTDFVWFLLSEEDKRTPTAIEYWFRCMDVDGDGALSMYELEYFYEEQQTRMESIGIETLPFEDCLCQMLDMIKPQRRDCITLSDLKRCKMTHVFFDTFFNLEKYLDHEQRDPFASQRDEYTSDWDRFAAQEYELLITEENE